MPPPQTQMVLPVARPAPPQWYTFQVWGGKGQKWLTYEEAVQRRLNHLWANGGGELEVTIDDHVYTIRLRAIGDMDQDRVDTERPARKVRILELEGT